MHRPANMPAMMHEGILRNTVIWSDAVVVKILTTHAFFQGPVSRALLRRFRDNAPSGVSSELDGARDAQDMERSRVFQLGH